MFLIPGGAATIMIVNTSVTAKMALHFSSSPIPNKKKSYNARIINQTILKQPLHHVGRFLVLERREGTVDGECENNGIVQKREPCR